MKYDADYFIKKFEAIPDNKWTTNHFMKDNKFCALGHCGVKGIGKYYTQEASALDNLFRSNLNIRVETVNDGFVIEYNENNGQMYGDTPKERILVALEYIKALEE